MNGKKSRSNFRLFLLGLISVAMATFLLLHFCFIWVFGKFYIAEPNTMILTLETVAIISILCFSAYCVLEQFKEIK